MPAHSASRRLTYIFRANGAGSSEPGATPQELMHLKSPALKARFIAVQAHEEFDEKHPAP
jgi:hypothetical protein